MLEMWQALATGLGTNTSSHSEQGKAIVADEVIGKRQWGSRVTPHRMLNTIAFSVEKAEIVLKTLRAQLASITSAALQRNSTIFVFTKLTVVADGDRP